MAKPSIRGPGMDDGANRRSPRHYSATFLGGTSGDWRVDRIDKVRGATLASVSRIEVLPRLEWELPAEIGWSLRGVTEEEHYASQVEQERLLAVQPELGRPACTRAALIPIRKSQSWWGLPRDQRRAIFEDRSRHVAVGLEYLPAVARRLYHSRRLAEPFDFLTWFEFTPKDSFAFDQLVRRLRETEEWRYVEREVDIRLHRPDRHREQEGVSVRADSPG